MCDQIPAVILAGGLSSRMGGGDKGLLPLGDTTLLGQVIDRLRPQVCEIVLNANGDASRFDSYALPVVADGIADYAGPLAGVLAGMDWAAARGATHIVSVAADTPFFPTDLVARLVQGRGDAAIALAASMDPKRGQVRQPTFGLWPVALRDDLRAALQDGLRKVVIWTDRHGTAEVLFDGYEVEPFFNVNTPGDLAKARNMAASLEGTT
ncbi:molybdenum cofactor guanylyltransferase MobA [Thalassovita mediterranea]|jgi:molybdopterin-guanine dinucleotide biosynthesis protein A|uniref:Molybdenum cofactor guanylyltransferase n=1 Tax=Thalassovita mediterranea TaxID=340021 RepID=A0A0P1GNP2_9RHOB|nr:molybdenum cofactor guanylyltransferase MobA [Thalassovita mediterranea]CUH84065.1 Molybdenum cofactor guanylyltransferase [Thalassovita mediterranea]SIS27792.1 molybdenum cofactor guanylyltransferase [Thalassovita mediterranea]